MDNWGPNLKRRRASGPPPNSAAASWAPMQTDPHPYQNQYPVQTVPQTYVYPHANSVHQQSYMNQSMPVSMQQMGQIPYHQQQEIHTWNQMQNSRGNQPMNNPHPQNFGGHETWGGHHNHQMQQQALREQEYYHQQDIDDDQEYSDDEEAANFVISEGWFANDSDPKSMPGTPVSFQPPTPFLQQPQKSAAEVAELIHNFKERFEGFEEEIGKAAQQIRGISPIPLPLESADFLLQLLGSTKVGIEKVLNEAIELPHHSLLPCGLLYQLDVLNHEFGRQLTQIDIYIQEVESLVSNPNGTVFAYLYIQSTPFPTTIKQYHLLPPIEIRLLTGAKTQLNIMGPVKADLISANQTNGTSREKMEGFEQMLTHGVAVFNGLKFLTGTGCRHAQLKFSLSIQQTEPFLSEKQRIESPLTEAFIVMTNTKQWAEAQGHVLKRQLFCGKEIERSQEYFCNCLQFHHLQATRQPPSSFQRSLLPSDFVFLMQKKSNRADIIKTITPQGFDEFWIWFGTVMQKIRYQKFLLQMWVKGLFWGFISKEHSEKALENWEAGVFLLRFSESNPGAIAIAYKQSATKVRHYLLKGSDLAQGRSLPQFIRETSSLLFFLRITTGAHWSLQLNLAEKGSALAKIGGKRKKQSSPESKSYYDGEIQELNLIQKMQKVTISPTQTQANPHLGHGSLYHEKH